jgi:hypothetical protein
MLMKMKPLTRKTTKYPKSHLIEIAAISEFMKQRVCARGELKMRDDPTMLLKTKQNQCDSLDDPTMLIKTNDLIF